MSSPSASIENSEKIDRLLVITAKTMADAIAADLVCLMFIDHNVGDHRFLQEAGNLAGLHPGSTALDAALAALLHEGIPPNPGRVALPDERTEPSSWSPPPVLLQEFGLESGLLVRSARSTSRLAMFAGRTTSEMPWDGAEATRAGEILDIAAVALGQIAAMLRIVEAKHQCESTMDTLPQLIALLDGHGHVIRTNLTLEQWSLGRVDSIRGVNVHDMLHPSCSDWNCRLRTLCDDMWRQFDGGGPVDHEFQDHQLNRDLHLALMGYPESRYGDGMDTQASATLVVEDISRRAQAERMLRNYNEELENRLQSRTLDLTRVDAQLKKEIVEHLRDAEALRQTNKKYNCLVEATLMGIYVIRDGRLVFCNGRFSSVFGYPHEEIYQLDMDALFPDDAPVPVGNVSGSCEALDQNFERNVVRGLTRNGNTLWLQRTLTSVDYIGSPMIVGNIIDITDQKNMEAALLDSRNSLQLLSKKLIQAQELERKRIASELHDSIGQSISAVKFSIENALRDADEGAPHPCGQHLHNAILKLRDTMEEVRRISMDLRPSMLDDLGLIATINWLCRDLQSLVPEARFNIQIDVTDKEIPAELDIVIFRMLQEALNNICKHAHAGNVFVRLTPTDDGLRLLIEDDGRGFSVDSLSDAHGFGLGSMRERVELSGGRFTIESAPGSGTTVRAYWNTNDGGAATSH